MEVKAKPKRSERQSSIGLDRETIKRLKIASGELPLAVYLRELSHTMPVVFPLAERVKNIENDVEAMKQGFFFIRSEDGTLQPVLSISGKTAEHPRGLPLIDSVIARSEAKQR